LDSSKIKEKCLLELSNLFRLNASDSGAKDMLSNSSVQVSQSAQLNSFFGSEYIMRFCNNWRRYVRSRI
jgi:hypothetical protein